MCDIVQSAESISDNTYSNSNAATKKNALPDCLAM